MNHPHTHHNSVPEYQLSGVPFVTSSTANEVGTTPIEVNFPFVTRWVEIRNTGALNADNSIRVGFTEAGVQAASSSNYYVLSGALSTTRWELRCNKLWFRQHGGSTSGFSLVAGLTSVDESRFFELTASLGFEGVG